MAQKIIENEPSGLVILDKPEGITSHDAVYKLRRLYGTKRVGHTGTLDPLATGVLVMLIGRAAKAAEYLVCDSKEYRATLHLGLTTDTEDITGRVLTSTDVIPSAEAVLSAVARFCGELEQVPPMYSALKVGGKKLCDLAREGKTVEREARKITVHSISATPTDSPCDYILDVHCSSGTYIRTLCADIGASLGCGAVMSTLRRTSAGGFSVDDAHTLEEFESMTPEQRLATLIPTEELFAILPQIVLPDFYFKLCKSGCEIYQKKIRTDYPLGTRVRLCTPAGTFFALGEVFDYPDGTAVKSVKLFEL